MLQQLARVRISVLLVEGSHADHIGIKSDTTCLQPLPKSLEPDLGIQDRLGWADTSDARMSSGNEVLGDKLHGIFPIFLDVRIILHPVDASEGGEGKSDRMQIVRPRIVDQRPAQDESIDLASGDQLAVDSHLVVVMRVGNQEVVAELCGLFADTREEFTEERFGIPFR